MNYDDLIWKCQGVLDSQDYMRLVGLIVAEKELRHSKTMLEEQLENQKHSIVRECAEVAGETRWAVPPTQEQIARSIKQHFGVE
jgi:hypothetical protein